MNNIRDDHQVYWNDVADKVIGESGEITYNFYKHQQIMHRLLKFPYFSGTVLEIGCGFGMIGYNLRNICSTTYIGIEISDHYVKHCQDVLKLDVRQHSVEYLPIEGNTVDYIFSFDVLEHIDPNDRSKAYHELGRVLKPDGTMLINNPAAENGSGHNPAYEFGFNLNDLHVLLEVTKLKLTQLERFRINIQQENNRVGWWDYEWMVLQRLSQQRLERTSSQDEQQEHDQGKTP